MEQLNKLELTLLDGLAQKYPSLKSHIPFLMVSKREMTNMGISVHFAYENFNAPLDDLNALFSNQEMIETNNLKNGLTYVIDVTDGEITYIEFITNGEKWDGKYQEFAIIPHE